MLFGVMLTRRLSGVHITHGSKNIAIGVIASVAVLGLVSAAIYKDPMTQVAHAGPFPADTEAIGALFLTPDKLMLPFEVLSILLLAAMIGAITLARKVDP